MKSIPYLLAVSLFVPALLLLASSAVAAASLFTIAGLAAIVSSDYGRSTEPSYAKSSIRTKSAIERLPLAA